VRHLRIAEERGLYGHLGAIIPRASNHPADAGSRAGNGQVTLYRRRGSAALTHPALDRGRPRGSPLASSSSSPPLGGAATRPSQARYDGATRTPVAAECDQGTVT
jgi:hypothetical protein